MNEFVEQFLLEARELVDQATDDLLALEERPDDKSRLDSAFRAFHTLKGAAGIVDFDAMARSLHAAEDVLAAIRAGADPVTPQLISDCLTSLDQVVRWLDVMQIDGTPPHDADASADAIVRLFALRSDLASERIRKGAAPSDHWVRDLLARHATGSRAATAIRYTPDPGCFFRGEDPLSLLADLPGLLAIEVEPAGLWPPLEEWDPFSCRVTLLALIAGSEPEASRVLRDVMDQVLIQPLDTSDPGNLQSALSPAGRALLKAQIMLLGQPGLEDGLSGRLASAGRTASNVLRRFGQEAAASDLDRASARSLADRDPHHLVTAIEHALDGTLVGQVASSPADERDAKPDATRGTAGPMPIDNRETAARALRVDVERIDDLVRLTGELTVAKNGIAHLASLAQGGTDPKLLATMLKERHDSLDRLVRELQDSVLNIRVLPLSHVFHRFPRLVREMSTVLGKPARLVMDGELTEADKTIVEALFEPLLHAVRNALDHGVESAEERAARGKPQPATIVLRAARQGEHVVVEVEDDGRGIDVRRVRQVAAERGLGSAGDLAALNDQEVIELIFAPGFSTATTVTGLSGRGVGMDAVRSTVERLGGRVAIESRPGQGTTARFKLPFTIMMTRVITVEAGGQVFGIPFDAVVETVRIPRDKIVPVGKAQAFVFRDRTIPLIDLAHALGERAAGANGAQATIVITSVGGQLGGLEVEKLGVGMDVMLTPVSGLLTGIPGVAGTTLLSDGRVLIVLELQEILE